jgi:hypothetical protein
MADHQRFGFLGANRDFREWMESIVIPSIEHPRHDLDSPPQETELESVLIRALTVLSEKYPSVIISVPLSN